MYRLGLTRSQKLYSYNPGQNCWDISRFPPSPHCNVDLSRSPKSRSVHRSLACFNIVWGEGGRKKGSERRKRIAHITMEVCTVNFLLFAQNLTSVPKSFDPDCSSICFVIRALHFFFPMDKMSLVMGISPPCNCRNPGMFHVNDMTLSSVGVLHSLLGF